MAPPEEPVSKPESSDETEPGKGAEDSLTSSKSVEEPLTDSRANDSLDAPDLDNTSPAPFIVASAQSLPERQTAAIARVVAENLADVQLGKYLPDGLSREKRERLIKAEAMWLSGVNSVGEIAEIASVSKASVYAWAAAYHWKKRADIAQLGQDALKAANMVAIAAKARAAAENARAAESASPAVGKSEVAGSTGVQVDGVIDLLAERGARPMSEEDAARQSLIEQATADAHQNTLMSMFVQVISEIVDKQQQASNGLVAWGTEMLGDLQNAYAVEKANNGKRATAKEVRETVMKNLPMYRQLVAALTQAIALQRRVWMIADPGRGALEGGDGFGGDVSDQIGAGTAGTTVPVQRDSYEATVIAAEKGGLDLTRTP